MTPNNQDHQDDDDL